MPRIIKLAKGTYTSSTITVDGDGRVITASSGSAGGGTYVTTTFETSGTFTPDPGTQFCFAMAVGGGGGHQGNPGSATNFGNLLSAPGGQKSGPGAPAGGAGTNSSTGIFWSHGKAAGSNNAAQQASGGTVGAQVSPNNWRPTNNVNVLDGAGYGGNSHSQPTRGAGSGGVAAAYYNSPQYAPTTHTVSIGTGGNAPSGPNDKYGRPGRVVVVEFVA